MKKALLGVFAFGVVSSSQALVWGFAAPILTGSQEVPPTGSSAFGSASFTVDDQTWEVTGAVVTTGLPRFSTANPVTGMHIHQAPMGVNGPVRFDILANLVSHTGFGNHDNYFFNGTLGGNQAAILAAWIAGEAYINVHTQNFPGGEIRGQAECVGVVPEPATLAALGFGATALLRRRRK